MTESQPFRVGVVGSSPQGCYLLERLSLLANCELVGFGSAPVMGALVVENWHRFLSESELKAVLFLNGQSLEPAQLQEALDANILIGVLPPLGGEPADWESYTSASPEQLRVLQPHNENPDFRAALAWVQSGEMGPVASIKRVSWVPDLIEPQRQQQPKTAADEWFSQLLWEDVDQLLQLAGTLPESIYATEFSEAGERYFLILNFASGMVGHLERRRSSVVPLELGWTLTGPTGGYTNQQRFIKTDAGEIYDVPAELPPLEGDPLFAPLTTLSQSIGSESSWRHALDVLRVHQVVLQSAKSGQVVRLDCE